MPHPVVVRYMAFNTAQNPTFVANSIYLDCTAMQVAWWPYKCGSGISNMCEKFAPKHRARGTSHAQWLQMQCQW